MIWSAISTDSCEIHKHEIDRNIKMLPSSNKYGSQWIINLYRQLPQFMISTLEQTYKTFI